MMYDKKIAAVQAKWTYINTKKNIVTLFSAQVAAFHHEILLLMTTGKKRFATLYGSAQALRTSTLKKHNGWNEAPGEDFELSFRLMKAGQRITYLPQLNCASELPTTLKDLSAQQYRWSNGSIIAARKNLDIFFNKKVSNMHKFLVFYTVSGYLLSIVVALALITKIITIITIPWFDGSSIIGVIFETIVNTLLISGALIPGTYVIFKTEKTRIIQYLSTFMFIGTLVFFRGTLRGIIGGILNNQANGKKWRRQAGTINNQST